MHPPGLPSAGEILRRRDVLASTLSVVGGGVTGLFSADSENESIELFGLEPDWVRKAQLESLGSMTEPKTATVPSTPARFGKEQYTIKKAYAPHTLPAGNWKLYTFDSLFKRVPTIAGNAERVPASRQRLRNDLTAEYADTVQTARDLASSAKKLDRDDAAAVQIRKKMEQLLRRRITVTVRGARLARELRGYGVSMQTVTNQGYTDACREGLAKLYDAELNDLRIDVKGRVWSTRHAGSNRIPVFLKKPEELAPSTPSFARGGAASPVERIRFLGFSRKSQSFTQTTW